MNDEAKAKSWWQTLPGVLTAVAGILTAITGLIVAVHQTGVLPVGKQASAPLPPPRHEGQSQQQAPPVPEMTKPLAPTVVAPGTRTEVPPLPPQEGTVLRTASGASLTLESHLHAGSNATLYTAKTQSGNRVVVKIFSRGLDPGSPSWEQFKQEQRTAETLKHPNIIRILDTGMISGYPYTVMEYYRGRSLHEWLQTHDRIPGPQILSIARHIAAAIDFAHSQGIVHRDIKPGNILLDPDPQGRVVLADFGVARVFGAVQRNITAVAQEMVGSPAYLAPEAIEGEEISGASDIYSFGVVLYEMIAGRSPFEGFQGVAALLRAKISKDAPDIREYRKDVAPQVASRLSQTLSRKPSERPKSAGAVLSGIERDLSRLP